MPDTSLQRTYRNLRLGIAATVVAIGVSVAIESARVGVLASISDYFYTPIRAVFVGALVAAALGILTLSGYGVQRALLGAAGLFAPLIALVPTPLRRGEVPGFSDGCPAGVSCVPRAFDANIDTGILSYLIVGGLVIAVAIVSSAVQVRTHAVTARSVVPSLAVAVAILVAVGALWIFAHDWFVSVAHLGSAGIFFGLIGLVAVFAAFGHATGPDPAPVMKPWRRNLYWVIAVALFVDVAVVVAVPILHISADTSPPPIFVGEFIALGLFVAFWILQSIQNWSSLDPRIREAPLR